MDETTTKTATQESSASSAETNAEIQASSYEDSAEIARLKNAVSKANGEVAELKKQLRSKMTEDEAAKQKEQEDRKALEDKYNELLKKSTISEHTANFLALGYDADLAKSTAEALFEGNTEKVFENQKKFNEAMERKLRAELVKHDPRPGGAGGGSEEEKNKGVEIAKMLAARKAASRKESDEVMKHYLH